MADIGLAEGRPGFAVRRRRSSSWYRGAPSATTSTRRDRSRSSGARGDRRPVAHLGGGAPRRRRHRHGLRAGLSESRLRAAPRRGDDEAVRGRGRRHDSRGRGRDPPCRGAGGGRGARTGPGPHRRDAGAGRLPPRPPRQADRARRGRPLGARRASRLGLLPRRPDRAHATCRRAGPAAGPPSAWVSANRLDAVQAGADDTGTVVLLKGADTLVAGPGGTPSSSTSAVPGSPRPGAATSSRVVAAFLAKGMEASVAAAAAAAACGVASRLAGERHGQAGMIARDVVESLSPALSQ